MQDSAATEPNFKKMAKTSSSTVQANYLVAAHRSRCCGSSYLDSDLDVGLRQDQQIVADAADFGGFEVRVDCSVITKAAELEAVRARSLGH